MSKAKSVKKRLLSLALLAALVVSMLAPLSVSAASQNYRFQTLGAGTWANKSYKYDGTTGIHYTYYTIKVAKPGQLSFAFSSDGYIRLYTSASALAKGVSGGSRTYLKADSESKSVAVEAGTYYMEVSEGKAKYSFIAAPSAPNYCVAKATALAANTAAKIMLTPKTNYCRWFKITNPSKKKIIFWTNLADYAYNTELFNANMARLSTVKYGSDTRYITKAAFPKGTYYLCVKRKPRYAGDLDYAFGDIVTIKWK